MVTLLAGGMEAGAGGGGTGQKCNLADICLTWTSYGLNERYWSTEKYAEIRLKKY